MTKKVQHGVTRKALWSVIAFYLLIAFEIAYMAGPFAVYFYGVYNPIQNFFNTVPLLSELNRFFLPHVARETGSVLINIHALAGGVLAAVGFAAFLAGACQIYYSKFAKKGAVTGGIYSKIRHPQYVSFAICGLGLLIVWPRLINLIMYVTMLFVYFLLAKAEERECEEKFGQSYIDFKNRTNMFIPFKLPFKLPSLPQGKGKKAAVMIGMYLSCLVVSFFAAKLITSFSVDSLFAVYTDSSASISLAEIEESKLNDIINIAASDAKVKAIIESAGEGSCINYIMPAEWFTAEIPMNGLTERAAHVSPADYDNTKYKIIYTAVQLDGETAAYGKDILMNVKERVPLAEVRVDLKEGIVTRVLEIPEEYKYKGVPVAVY